MMPKTPEYTLLTNRPIIRVANNNAAPEGSLFAPGGLASALSSALTNGDGGKFQVLSWNRASDDEFTLEQIRRAGEKGRLQLPFSVGGVQVSDQELRGYYERVSNGLLWPLFHGLTDRVRQVSPADWEAYVAVNRRFAVRAVRDQPANGKFWVHDYHLLLAPKFIRAAGVNPTVGFFLHIPFPSPEVFFSRSLPRGFARQIIDGLLSCDLIGTQTRRDAERLLVCAAMLGYEVDRRRSRVAHGEREVEVRHFPISIDTTRVSQLAKSPAALEAARSLRERHQGKIIYFGVERLDYTKGILERMQAFDHLLEIAPHMRGRAVMVQYAAPSRESLPEYERVRSQISETVRRVNARHSVDGWQPLEYHEHSLRPAEVMGCFSACDAAVVTPLVDGMNLVIKEAITACSDPTAFVLGKGAGAAEQLSAALLVDGADPRDIAGGLLRAHGLVTSRRSELILRHRLLKRVVEGSTVADWFEDFLSALDASAQRSTPVLPSVASVEPQAAVA